VQRLADHDHGTGKCRNRRVDDDQMTFMHGVGDGSARTSPATYPSWSRTNTPRGRCARPAVTRRLSGGTDDDLSQ
jgi:hypothetical protein